MPIHWDARNKRWRFTFNRVIAGRRNRASRLLPKGWTQAQADAFDRKEAARLYAVGSGVEQDGHLIEDAVVHYLRDKTHLKSHREASENLTAIHWAYAGRTFRDLPEVAAVVNATREGVRPGVMLSDATVRQRLALLKAACRWGWKAHGMGDRDPTVRMQMPTVRNERHVYATRSDIGKLVRAADRKDLRALILAAFYTGMRLGELQRVEVRSGTLYLADTKNGEPRAIPTHPRVRPLLRYLPFTAPRSTLERAWQRAREAAGLAHLHFHDLRHSAASEMVNAGVDLYTVGAVLGHRDQRSTKRYSHLTAHTLADAVGRIGRKDAHNAPWSGKKKAAV